MEMIEIKKKTESEIKSSGTVGGLFVKRHFVNVFLFYLIFFDQQLSVQFQRKEIFPSNFK